VPYKAGVPSGRFRASKCGAVGFGLLAKPDTRRPIIRVDRSAKRRGKSHKGTSENHTKRPKGTREIDTIQDFEDRLQLLEKHRVRYLIIGGLAFIYHAKPRYTKDMDLWIDPVPRNVEHANDALRMPVYICGRRDDGIATPAGFDAMRKHIPGSRLGLFKGGHLFFIQDPWAVERIGAFLRGALDD